MKTYFEMTSDERKAALAQEAAERKKYFDDFIQDAPQRIAAEAEAKKRVADELAAKREAAFRDSVRQSYVRANGSEAGFGDAWPSLREEIVKQQTIANVGKGDLVEQFIQQMNSR